VFGPPSFLYSASSMVPYCAANRGPAAQLNWPGCGSDSAAAGPVPAFSASDAPCPTRSLISSCRSPRPLDSGRKVLFVRVVVLLFLPAVVVI
jgi:hypothetical protein